MIVFSDNSYNTDYNMTRDIQVSREFDFSTKATLEDPRHVGTA